MKTPLLITAAAIVASTLAVAPAQAEGIRVQVDYSDLDVSSPVGEAVLASRIEARVDQACARSEGIRNLKAVASCKQALMANAEAQLAEIVAAGN